MKRLAIAILLFLVCQLFLAPVHTFASGLDWTTGYYYGKVEFYAWITYSENRFDQEVTYKQDTDVTIHSTGRIVCTIYDVNGNGTCVGNFPTESHENTVITIKSPDCYAERTELTDIGPSDQWRRPNNWIGITGTRFSFPFTTSYAVPQTHIKNYFTGISPKCDLLSKVTTKTDVNIPKWPSLDFIITIRSLTTVHGICNMKGFPIIKGLPYSIYAVKIQKCEWNMYWGDSNATLP
jgi:hypothetical protein